MHDSSAGDGRHDHRSLGSNRDPAGSYPQQLKTRERNLPMPAISTARRVLMTLVACFAFASVSIAPAFGAGAQSAVHHKKRHHKRSHHKCSNPRGDKDRDGVEGHGGNDGDGCGV